MKTTTHPRLLLTLLLLMCLLGAFPLDVILPSFPQLSTRFSVEPEQISLSVSLFVLSVAAAQLFIGPLSDRMGRKHLLLAGLLLSIGGAVGCLLARNYAEFLGFRLLQALGCGCFVLTQALIQDVFDGAQRNAVRVVLTSASGLFISISPLLGSWLQEIYDWQASFIAFALLAGLALLMSARLLANDSIGTARSTQVFGAYLTLVQDRAFLGYTALVAMAFACHLSFIIVSPLLFLEQMGLSTYAFSLAFMLYGIAYIIGGLIAGVANRHLKPSTQIASGLCLMAISGGALLICAWRNELSISSVMVPMVLCTTGISLVRPAATGCALDLYSHSAGAAASLLSTLVFALGAGASSVVALISDQLPLSLGIVFLASAVTGALLLMRLHAHMNGATAAQPEDSASSPPPPAS